VTNQKRIARFPDIHVHNCANTVK